MCRIPGKGKRLYNVLGRLDQTGVSTATYRLTKGDGVGGGCCRHGKPSFMIGSSSELQETRLGINTQMK